MEAFMRNILRYLPAMLLLIFSAQIFAEDAETRLSLDEQKVKAMQLKVQKMIEKAVRECNIENGSDYSKQPIISRLKNKDATITMEAATELEGMKLLGTKGHYDFNSFSRDNVSVKGRLNFELEYINGSTANFKGKFRGKLVWKIKEDKVYDVDAEYDYTLEMSNGKYKTTGTVKVGDQVYVMNQDGTVNLKPKQ